MHVCRWRLGVYGVWCCSAHFPSTAQPTTTSLPLSVSHVCYTSLTAAHSALHTLNRVLLCSCVFVCRANDRPAVYREGPGDISERLYQSRREQAEAGQTVRLLPVLLRAKWASVGQTRLPFQEKHPFSSMTEAPSDISMAFLQVVIGISITS